MEGIVTVTVDVTSLDVETKAKLEDALNGLGLRTTLPETEGGTLHLPSGTYGNLIEVKEQMDQMKHYYRNLVGIMRKLKIKEKYFVNVSQKPTFVCGEL
ncbi:MAG: hypothetical protein L6437_00875 [Kiritimatiellae bacterium]|nr:hypothetical protein [Verrucomicrobiota bacterium]MCG2658785.1 hypothetical protein [Kiritimatiellia bacterium]